MKNIFRGFLSALLMMGLYYMVTELIFITAKFIPGINDITSFFAKYYLYSVLVYLIAFLIYYYFVSYKWKVKSDLVISTVIIMIIIELLKYSGGSLLDFIADYPKAAFDAFLVMPLSYLLAGLFDLKVLKLLK